MYPFLHIGNLSLPMYGLCTLVGTVLALLAVFRLRKKGSPLDEDNLLDALIWAIVLGFVCSKLLYFVVDPPQMPHSWRELWDIISTGLVFYGGLIGGLLGLLIVSKKTKKHIL
ncbi:MAG: prolipoprotein diacylglyceryl transferase, partial [Clostridia bacterium]|nr:prolipoprotein diacylglyceryl transferase [Clostridia bacterium]